MVRDHLTRFILEIGVVDAEVRIKPIDFVRDELSRDEPLRSCHLIEKLSWKVWTHLRGYCLFNQGALLVFALEDGSIVTWLVFNFMQRRVAAVSRVQRR